MFDASAAEMHDRPAIVAVAHQLVGSSLSVGANRLAAAARRLEHAGGAEPPEPLAALLETLEAEATQALDAIAATIAPAAIAETV